MTDLYTIIRDRGLRQFSNTEYGYFDLENITEIDLSEKKVTVLFCFNCPNLLSIPYFSLLETLVCHCCYSLCKITPSLSLRILNCSGCSSLEILPELKNLEELKCSNTKLKCIENFPKLHSLDCSECKHLSSIKEIPSLVLMDCQGCENLSSLEGKNFPKLLQLSCSESGLKEINGFISLEELECNDCRYLIKILNNPHLSPIHFSCDRCIWLPCNEWYVYNVQNLICLQNFFRKNKKFFRVRRWLKSKGFFEWYYSPSAPGGKISVKNLKRRGKTCYR